MAVLGVRDNANPDCNGVEIKGKVVPVYAMKDNRRSSGIATRTVNRFTPQEMCCRYPFNGRFGWGFDLRVVQPMTYGATDIVHEL